MKMIHHLPELDVVNYIDRHCYPTFNFSQTIWKRKIKAFRVRYLANGAKVPEVQVWRTLGYAWVPTRDIEFIWNYQA